MTNIKNIQEAVKKGVLHIVTADFVNKIMKFGRSIILVRVLSKSDYGTFSYAMTIIGLFMMFNGIGSFNGVMQFCSAEKNENNKIAYLKYGIKIGLAFNLLLSLLIFSLSFIIKLPVPKSSELVRMLSFTSIFIIIGTDILLYLRSSFRNKEYSLLNIINTSTEAIILLIGGILLNIKGVIASRYLAPFLLLLYEYYIIKDIIKKYINVNKLTHDKRIKFIRYSITSMFANISSQILFLMDIFIIGLIIKDSNIIASYKVSTVIPFNILFLPSAFVTFVYPYFARQLNNKEWILKKYIIFQKYLIFINGIITLILIIFAKYIIYIIFGKEYNDSIICFRILSIGFFIAGSFRMPAGNILAAIMKVKINLYNSIISGIINILLDIILIKYIGSIGAALATVTVIIISSLISNIYLYRYLRIKSNNKKCMC